MTSALLSESIILVLPTWSSPGELEPAVCVLVYTLGEGQASSGAAYGFYCLIPLQLSAFWTDLLTNYLPFLSLLLAPNRPLILLLTTYP